MIVGEFNVSRSFACPYEAYTELIVDPDRVLTGSAGLQRLQTITRWCLQIAELGGRVQVAQFTPGHVNKVGRESLRGCTMKHGFSDPVSEADDHRLPFV